RYLSAQLLDRTDSIKMRTVRQRAQIERRGELAIHDGLTLRADEVEVVPPSANMCRRISAGGADDLMERRRTAGYTAAKAQTDFQYGSPRYHSRPPFDPINFSIRV